MRVRARTLVMADSVRQSGEGSVETWPSYDDSEPPEFAQD
jgi:hypothetical protein